MGADTKIEWCNSTWNPTRGCSRVSPGCGGPGHAGGCYAESVAARFSDPGAPYHGFAERGRAGSKWTGKVALIEDMLTVPLRWKKPRRIFVNSMSDLFHEALSDADIDKVFAIMALCPQHSFQVLTKRAQRMRDYLDEAQGNIWDAIRRVPGARPNRVVFRNGEPIIQTAPAWPLPNVWLGVSVEDQPRADERIPLLLETPASVRFLSCEPLLGPLDLSNALAVHRLELSIGPHWTERTGEVSKLDWIIAGGESGSGARPMHPDWARSLRDQCAAAGVPFFFKQWGEWVSEDHDEAAPYVGCGAELGKDLILDDVTYVRVGKRAAGRLLDGREHSEFPETR